MRVSRISSSRHIIATVIALDENSIIFQIVSFVWAGFGATFGPLILMRVFPWLRDRVRLQACSSAAAWSSSEALIRPIGALNIYELGPSFLLSLIAIVVVSKLTVPDPEVLAQHDRYVREYEKS